MKVLTLVVVLGVLSQTKGTSTTRSSSYGVCPKGLISAAQQQTQNTVSSTLQCLARCSETPDCRGVNVCPGELSGQVRCALTREVVPGSCEGLTPATSPLCFHVQSAEETSGIGGAGETSATTQAEETTSAVIGTTEEKTPAVIGTTEETTPAVIGTTEETTPAVIGTTEETTSAVIGTTEETTPAVIGTTEETTSAVIGTTEETTPAVIGTTELECQNNGTPSGDTCDCPVEYSGKACQRRIRDCSEAYDNGHRNEGIYLIQPATAPSPFQVHCKFQWGGVTWAFRRSAGSDVSRDWVTYTQGFGDPSTVPFFIGLDNLHHLTNQAAYEFQIWIESSGGDGGAKYDNLTFGPESTSYVVAFDRLNPDSEMDNWFAASPPVRFSSPGHDTNNCYAQKGKAGWYGNDCSGYGMLSNGNFYWSQSGSEISVNTMYFMLVRKSPYYD